jgi:antitoxin StbD
MPVGQRVLARLAVAITELRRNPAKVLSAANGSTVAVLNKDRIAAYLVPAATYERMTDELKAAGRLD